MFVLSSRFVSVRCYLEWIKGDDFIIVSSSVFACITSIIAV